jgi:hypothetical protein
VGWGETDDPYFLEGPRPEWAARKSAQARR